MSKVNMIIKRIYRSKNKYLLMFNYKNWAVIEYIADKTESSQPYSACNENESY